MDNQPEEMNSADNERGKTSLLKRFLKIFLPLFLALIFVTCLFVTIEFQTQKILLQTTERNLVDLVSQSVGDDLRVINSDLLYLANLPQFIKFLDSGDPLPADLVEGFKLFSQHKKVYDQVRYLDASGMEVLRINYDGASASIVPSDKLQSKAKRYYFEDSFRLARGEVFVSPFDLNMEQGKVEVPLKPMIRFGTPVFDNKGNKRGIILLNYFGRELLSTLERYSGQSKSSLTMTNAKGYWLKGLDPEDEWGFMFPDKQDVTIFSQFPAIKNLFAQTVQGQTLNDDGLFTYAKANPLSGDQTSSNGSSKVYGASTGTIETDAYSWSIISYIWPEDVQAKLYRSLNTTVIVFCAFTLILALFCKLLTNNSMQKEKTAALVHAMAYHDALTDLPNRRLMDDRLRQTIAYADRSNVKVAIMFLDLDKFKPVNDTFGHEAGDQLLKMVSDRLKSGVRASDTVARLGGDEFLLICNGIKSSQDADTIADKVIKMISAPYFIDGHKIEIGTSIGIAIYPDDTSKAEEMVQLADQALYGAKDNGRNCYCRYADLKS